MSHIGRVIFAIIVFMLCPVFCWAQSFCVRKSGAELRSAPKAKAPISWKVGKFMPLQGTGKTKNGFVEVADLDGEVHWARLRDLSQRMKCLAVRVRMAKVRTGPGKEYPQALVASFDKYSPFKDLGGQDGWTQVEDDTGAIGWINLDHVWKAVNYRMRMSFESE